MIGILVTSVLAFAPQAEQPKLELYAIEDLINVKLEQRRQVEEQLALDLVTMALAKGSPEESGMDKLARVGTSALLDMARKSKKEEGVVLLGDLPLLSSLFDETPGDQPFQSTDDLLTHVQTFMKPAFEKHTHSLKIQRHGSERVLLAYLNAEQHEWTKQFLEMQRQRDKWAAQVYARLYLGDPAAIPDLEKIAKGGLQAGNGLPLANAAKTEEMCQRFAKANFELLTSPKVLSNPGQEAEVMVQNQLSYLADWKLVQVYPGPKEIADPVIDVLSEGMKMNSRVIQVGPNLYGLDINVEYSKAKRPIPTVHMEMGGKKYEVSLPELHTSQVETMLVLPGGGGAVFRLPNEASPGKDMFLVVEFTPIKLD